jgi:hypothetical protein
MKRLFTIFFVLCSVFANAQLKGTDTAHFVSNTSHKQFWASPYGVHKIFAMHNVGFRPGSWPVYATLPNGILTGELVWVEDSVRYAYWNGSVWNLMTPDGLGGVAGVSTFNTRSGAVTLQASDVSGVGGFLNGLNAFGANSTIGNSDNFALSIRTNNTERIGITNVGAVSIPAGTFTVGGTGNGTVNIQNSSASTRGSIDLTSNNPRLNSATGTWVFAQSGNTVGLYNGTGFFFGGGTAPSGFVVGILAGTTTNAPLRLNSGPLTTTPVAGNIEFLTDKFYGTVSTGPARKEFTLNDAALTSGRIPFATTNGRLLDDAGLSWDNSTKVLQLGGTSSSFPGLLRDGASIQVKLADNSANANLKVLDQAYDATTWNGNDEVPTKNAVRDKIESLSISSGDLVIINDADHTVLSTESAVRYNNNITANRTVTLPNPSTATGREIWVKWNIIDGAFSISITTVSGTALIYLDSSSGATSQPSNIDFLSMLFKSDGTSWYKIN